MQPDLPKQPPIEVAENDLGKAELQFAASVVAPLFWIMRNSRTGQEQIKNGTIFFLDTGTKLFAVTAGHVIQECLYDTRSPMFVQSMIGTNGGPAIGIHLGDRVIDGSTELDIATFRVTRDEIRRTNCTPLTGFQRNWPPPLAEVGYLVTLCGFPGIGRQWLAPRTISFGAIPLGYKVASVHKTAISIQLDREELIRVLGTEEMPENFDFGEMSGGPVLVISQRGSLRDGFPLG